MTDPGAKFDPNEIDTVVVVLTVSITGDQETLLLFETGPDTGVFVGHTQTVEDGVAVWGITYANTGGFMQTNVELTDILPSQTVSTANFVVISGPDILPATNPTGGTFAFDTIAVLPGVSGGVIEFDVTLAALEGETVTNEAQLLST